MMLRNSQTLPVSSIASLLLSSVFSSSLAVGQSSQPERPSAGLNSKNGSAQYIVDVWETNDGLPHNSVESLAQTHDGYLWFGTQRGLVRFDGLSFTVFDNQNTKEIKRNAGYALLADRDGGLWMGTGGGGAVYLKDGTFKNYSVEDGLPGNYVPSLYQDREGSVWFGTTGTGLARLSHGSFALYSANDGLLRNLVSVMHQDKSGALWIGTTGGYTRYFGGRFFTSEFNEEVPNEIVKAFLEDRKGNFWVGTTRNLFRMTNGRLRPYTLAKGLQHPHINGMCEDKDGNLWIGTFGDGLYRFDGKKLTRFSEASGLSSNFILSLLSDRDGNLWVGTDRGGLNRLRKRKVTTYTTENGLSNNYIRSVCEDQDGSLWVGTYGGGLNRLKDGTVRVYTTKDGLSSDLIRPVFIDRRGNLWVGTFGRGVNLFRDGRWSRFTTNDGLPHNTVRAITQDHAGAIWIGTNGGGVCRYVDGQFTVFDKQRGLSSNLVSSILEDNESNVWVGTSGEGVNRISTSGIKVFTTKDGLSSDVVSALYQDQDAAIWIGTFDRGLNRLVGNKITQYTVEDGLIDHSVFQIIEDRERNLWLTTTKGIARVLRRQIDDLDAKRIDRLTPTSFGTNDGMLTNECTDGCQSSAYRTRDGKLWFATVKGLVMIDPSTVTEDNSDPRTIIEQVVVDKMPVEKAKLVALPPGQGELEVHYTAISFSNPNAIRFEYKLDGIDETWTDAGARRIAYYTHLPDGNFTFRVRATKGNGAWSDQIASLQLTILPPYWRTWWFRSLIIIGILGVVAVIVRARIVKLKRERAAHEEFSRRLIETQENDRKRIAAGLHDSIGQDLLLIKNRALMGLSAMENQEATREHLNKISSIVSEALDEVREISYDLHPYQLDRLGLTKAIESILHKVSSSSSIVFSRDIDVVDEMFSKDAEMNIYRIIQESVNNIVKHSGGSEATIAIKRNGNAVSILIQDNGEGFSPHSVASSQSRQRGFGLSDISERVKLFGGTLSITSTPGEGTTIAITIKVDEKTHGD